MATIDFKVAMTLNTALTLVQSQLDTLNNLLGSLCNEVSSNHSLVTKCLFAPLDETLKTLVGRTAELEKMLNDWRLALVMVTTELCNNLATLQEMVVMATKDTYNFDSQLWRLTLYYPTLQTPVITNQPMLHNHRHSG